MKLTCKIGRQLLVGALAVAGTANVAPAQAQTEINSPSDWVYSIPKRFSYTGEPQLMFHGKAQEGQAVYRVYDKELNSIKDVTIDMPVGRKEVIEERSYTVFEEVVEERTETEAEIRDRLGYDESWTFETEEIGINYYLSRAYDVLEDPAQMTGTTHVYVPEDLLLYGYEGVSEYRKVTYVEGAKKITVQTIRRRYVFSDWQATEERLYYGSWYSYYVRDFDTDRFENEWEGCLTQTLFNTDDKYEYLLPVYEWGQPRDTLYWETGPWNDEYDYVYVNDSKEYLKRMLYYSVPTSVTTRVMSDDGTVLHTIPGSVDDVFLLGGKTYLVASEATEEDDHGYTTAYRITFYELGDTPNSIKAVRTEESVKFYPRLARRNESVTIETDAATAGQAREVRITSIDGRLVDRVNLPVGETRAQVGTSRLNGGLYNFTVFANGKKLDNGKIVVK